jgi:hypothetical protein
MDARLVVIEREGAQPRDADVRWMEADGLDQSVHRRGLAVMAPAHAARLTDTPGVRVLRPLGERLVKPA